MEGEKKMEGMAALHPAIAQGSRRREGDCGIKAGKSDERCQGLEGAVPTSSKGVGEI